MNDVIPALTRAGCNQGTCHGAAAGKGGFRLSLRGFAPEMDYVSITQNAGGRRISRTDPAKSLLMRKPMLELPHRGGLALRPNSLEFDVLSEWLRAGAPGVNDSDMSLKGIYVIPNQRFLTLKEVLRLSQSSRLSQPSPVGGTRPRMASTLDYGTSTTSNADRSLRAHDDPLASIYTFSW